MHLKEWERRSPSALRDAARQPGPLPHGSRAGQAGSLAGLRLASPADRALAARLTGERVLVVRELAEGLEIESTSYVGKVQLDALTITIVPKLGGDVLARLFRYAYGLRDLRLLPAAPFAAGGSLFEDLLPRQLLAEVEELLARGLDRRYVTVEEPLASPRGRIDLGRIAREGGVVRGSLPCRHHLRREDCLLNQVLLGGLHLAGDIASAAELKMALRRLAGALAVGVRARPLNRQLVAQAQQGLDRMATSYAPALALISLLLDGAAPALEGDQPAVRIPGFLLDMNRFFQQLIGRFLRESLEGCRVVEERQLDDLMRYAPGENPGSRRAPRPRPDFLVTTGDGRAALLDAKYRDLWRRDLPREMLYQLAIYALSQPRGGQATILYPTTATEARLARIEIRDPLGGWDRASVALQPVELGALDRALAAGPRGATERGALARAMVFPGPGGGMPAPALWR